MQYFNSKNLDEKNLDEKLSIYRWLYMIVRLCIMLFLIGFHIEDMREQAEAKNILAFVIQGLLNIGMVLILCVSVLQCFFSTRKIKLFYLEVNQILKLIEENFRSSLDFKRIKINTFLRFSTLFALFTGFFILSADFTRFDYIFYLGYIPIFFLILIIFHYIFFVDLTNQFIRFLTSIMHEILKNNEISVITIYGKKLSSAGSLNSVSNQQIEITRKVKICRQIYNKVFDCSKLINQSFGLTILLMLSNVVIALTISGYRLFVVAVEKRGMNDLLGKLSEFSI